MFTSTFIVFWVLLNLVAISEDTLISEDDAIKSQEAAKKFLRVFSATSVNESTEAPSSSEDININNEFGSDASGQVKGVIAIFNKISRLQCAHKCRLNEKCKDIAYKDGNTCLLLDRKGKLHTGRMEIIHPGIVI